MDDTTTAADVMRAMVTAFDNGDVSDIEAVVHPEYLDHQGLAEQRPIVGVTGFVQVVAAARRGYAELSVTIEDLIEGADRVAARLSWNGVRLSGDTVRRETIEIVRVESGRAVEHWGGHS